MNADNLESFCAYFWLWKMLQVRNTEKDWKWELTLTKVFNEIEYIPQLYFQDLALQENEHFIQDN